MLPGSIAAQPVAFTGNVARGSGRSSSLVVEALVDLPMAAMAETVETVRLKAVTAAMGGMAATVALARSVLRGLERKRLRWDQSRFLVAVDLVDLRMAPMAAMGGRVVLAAVVVPVDVEVGWVPQVCRVREDLLALMAVIVSVAVGLVWVVQFF